MFYIILFAGDCNQNVYFACDNRNCVGKLQVCDGHNDCGDNSDEEQDCGNNPRQFCTTHFIQISVS